MTWGSHCPECGRESCRWTTGYICEGRAPRPPKGMRLSVIQNEYTNEPVFYVEEQWPHFWFWTTWIECPNTRRSDPRAAIDAAEAWTKVRYYS